jgi:hypothetical protein
MPIVVNLDDVVAGGAPPLEVGYYPATITKADIHPSKSSQEDTLYLDLAIGDDGRRGTWNCSMQPQALGRFKELLMRLDFELPEGDFEFDEQELVGVECSVYLTIEKHYRDPQRKVNRVSGIYAAGTDEDTVQDQSGEWG